MGCVEETIKVPIKRFLLFYNGGKFTASDGESSTAERRVWLMRQYPPCGRRCHNWTLSSGTAVSAVTATVINLHTLMSIMLIVSRCGVTAVAAVEKWLLWLVSVAKIVSTLVIGILLIREISTASFCSPCKRENQRSATYHFLVATTIQMKFKIHSGLYSGEHNMDVNIHDFSQKSPITHFISVFTDLQTGNLICRPPSESFHTTRPRPNDLFASAAACFSPKISYSIGRGWRLAWEGPENLIMNCEKTTLAIE